MIPRAHQKIFFGCGPIKTSLGIENWKLAFRHVHVGPLDPRWLSVATQFYEILQNFVKHGETLGDFAPSFSETS